MNLLSAAQGTAQSSLPKREARDRDRSHQQQSLDKAVRGGGCWRCWGIAHTFLCQQWDNQGSLLTAVEKSGEKSTLREHGEHGKLHLALALLLIPGQ